MDRKPQRMTVKFLLTLSPVPVTQIVYLALRKKNPKKIIITLLSISVIASDATRVTGFGRISKLLHEIIGAFEDSLEMKKRKKEPGPLGSNSGELAGGDSVDEGRCGEEEAEKKKGFVE
ncbi:hypothetical protein YC2023_098073 [Brassica napus]